MKNKLLFLTVLLVVKIFAQDSGTGIVVEYNKNVNIRFEVFNPPKRINKVLDQASVDYSEISGLMQSYLSASDILWAQSEYLDSETKIVRDEEHFTSVKNSSINDYIQLENIYRFNYNTREIAFVRYSFIFEKLPFPFVGVLSMEKSKDRWYLSNILNQGELYTFLKNFDNNFILDCFKRDSNNEKIKVVINNSLDLDGNLVLPKLFKTIEKTKKNDKVFFNSIRDQRMVVKDTPFRNGLESSSPEEFKFDNIFQSFVYDNVNFSKYQKKYQNLVLDEKTREEFKNSPEALLLTEVPVDLVFKINIEESNTNSYFLVYKKNNQKEVSEVLEVSKGNFRIINNSEYNRFLTVLKIMKPEFLIKVFNKQIRKSIASEIYTEKTVNLNLDLLYNYIISNKDSLSEYLE